MMNEFNKQRFYDNIEYLLKLRNMGVGEFETKAGVSTGYMARNKKDEKSRPGIEFIMAAAQVLGVSMDALLTLDLNDLNPTEQYLLDFFCKLHNDTLEDKLEWNRESADYLNRLEGDINGNSGHWLFDMQTFMEQGETEYPDEVTRIVFTSKNFDVHTAIHGDCFNLKMQNGSVLYLMNISKSVHRTDDPNAYCKEVWMCVPGEGCRFLCDNTSDNPIGLMVDALYDAISENAKHPKIGSGFKSVIDSFMKDEPITDASGLPFN